MSAANGPEPTEPRPDASGGVEYLPAGDGDAPQDGVRPRRRSLVAGVGAAAMTTLVAGAVYALVQFMSSGDTPATVVPADALGYISLDLDPGGGQKVAAWQTLRKFPSIAEDLAASSDGDVRGWLVTLINEEAPKRCRLDFDQDVEPWLGHKVAAALVERGGSVEPFAVVEVADVAAARSAVDKLAACTGEPAIGTATSGEFMIMAAGDLAADIAADGRRAPLADDATFRARVDEAGEAGVVTGYLAPRAVELMVEEQEKLQRGFAGPSPREIREMEREFEEEGFVTPSPRELREMELGKEYEQGEFAAFGSPATVQRRETRRMEREMFSPKAFEVEPGPPPTRAQLRRWRQELRQESHGFAGPDMTDAELAELEAGDIRIDEAATSFFAMSAASSLWGFSPLGLGPLGVFGVGPSVMGEQLSDFDGAALQVRFTDGGVEAQVAASGMEEESQPGGVRFTGLPDSTAVAFGSATGPDAITQVDGSLSSFLPRAAWKQMTTEFERSTGLSYPEDVQKVLGEALTVAVDGSVDRRAFDTLVLGAMGGESSSPVPMGVVVSTGEPEEVARIARAMAEALPGSAPEVYVAQGDGVVALGLDQAYVERLVAGGTLGGSARFRRAMPEGESVSSALYVDFDAGGWFERLTRSGQTVDQDVEPLSTLAMYQQAEGDDVAMLIRLGVD